ncbi:PaaI family thioesterase [uncultured Veillonella sp.]|uniref:PaaI family thioesterase n=1 Tax=uncultured Veillonella sp. TaxID=159268 RepID=UPI00260A91F8|nr:PaaI family thioesterase [uncultured Veillonella sp.]
MTLVDQLGIEYLRLTDEGFESAMTLNEFHQQPYGLLNGGAILAYCEAIAGEASNKLGTADYEALKKAAGIDDAAHATDYEELKVVAGTRADKSGQKDFVQMNLMAKGVQDERLAAQLAKGPYVAVGQTVTGQHLNSMKSMGRVIATGTLIKKGNRNHVWQIDIRNEEGLRISQVTVVNALIYPMGAKGK